MHKCMWYVDTLTVSRKPALCQKQSRKPNTDAWGFHPQGLCFVVLCVTVTIPQSRSSIFDPTTIPYCSVTERKNWTGTFSAVWIEFCSPVAADPFWPTYHLRLTPTIWLGFCSSSFSEHECAQRVIPHSEKIIKPTVCKCECKRT